MTWIGHSTDTLLHRHTITVGPDPPSGVFDWHYIQRVLRRFSTEEYQRLYSTLFLPISYEK
jgi:hypothetical protein